MTFVAVHRAARMTARSSNTYYSSYPFVIASSHQFHHNTVEMSSHSSARKREDQNASSKKIDAQDWEYRLEGGQKMLLSCKSPGLYSSMMNNVPVLCLYSDSFPAPSPETISPPLMITSAIHSCYLLPGEFYRLLPSTTSQLVNDAVASPGRLSSGRPSSFSAHPCATMHPDASRYFGKDTVLVEIKTKAGALPTSKLIPPNVATALHKYTVPPYHLKNYVFGDIKFGEQPYYPGDLLSGDIQKTKQAIDTLLSERSRILRVFQYSRQIDINKHASDPTVREAVQNAATFLAKDNTLVKQILGLQQLDYLDVHGAEVVLTTLIERHGSESKAYAKVESLLRQSGDPKHETIDADVRDQICYQDAEQAHTSHNLAHFQDALHYLRSLETWKLEQLLVRYLVSAVSKDCSVLVSMCKRKYANLKASCFGYSDDSDSEYVHKIWAIDLMRKDITKVCGKWPKQDRKRMERLKGTVLSDIPYFKKHYPKLTL